jgi:hypothetical protein
MSQKRGAKPVSRPIRGFRLAWASPVTARPIAAQTASAVIIAQARP